MPGSSPNSGADAYETSRLGRRDDTCLCLGWPTGAVWWLMFVPMIECALCLRHSRWASSPFEGLRRARRASFFQTMEAERPQPHLTGAAFDHIAPNPRRAAWGHLQIETAAIGIHARFLRHSGDLERRHPRHPYTHNYTHE